MSKPKNWWWGNALRLIRAYPELQRKKQDVQAARMTQQYTGMPQSKQPGRTTEQTALRQLTQQEEIALSAVERALEQLRLLPDGQWRVKAVQLYHWGRVRNLGQVAYMCNTSERTARRWNSDFVYNVAQKAGYMDGPLQ